MKEEAVRLRGKVVQVFQRHQYKIELENEHTVLGTLCGRMIKNRIWLSAGDACEIEMSPYDLSKARVVRRYWADKIFPPNFFGHDIGDEKMLPIVENPCPKLRIKKEFLYSDHPRFGKSRVVF
jgi:translation initiation factor IF-1